jgi:hypothetical protein
MLRQQMNPMGLLYSLYAAHEIALAQPVIAGSEQPASS